MFIWNAFREMVLASNAELLAEDDELTNIFISRVIPSDLVDTYGKPMQGCLVVNLHPDSVGFARALEIRLSLAEESANSLYCEYATKLLDFIKAAPIGGPIYIINIATRKLIYEFTYSPMIEYVFGSRVPH
jgi:hypothetical protein